MVTLKEAAERLQVSPASIRRLIAEKKLPASQVVEGAPWEIPMEVLDSELVRKAISNIKNRITSPRTQNVDSQQTMFSDT
jgi:excisionase family DNA binding protein